MKAVIDFFARWSPWARGMVIAQFAAAVALIVYAGIHDFPLVFAGAPPAVATDIAVSCSTGDCAAAALPLGDGRYRVAPPAGSGPLTITLRPTARDHARVVMLRAATAMRVRVGSGAERTIDAADGRIIEPLPEAAGMTVMLAPVDASTSVPCAVEEIGVYESPAGLVSDRRPLFRGIPPARYHGTLIAHAAARLCLFSILAAIFVPPTVLRRISPFALAALCFSLCLVDLAILFSPFAARDLRVVYAAGPVIDPPGSNLNGGLWQGFRLLQGRGLTLADGVVPWERMPGYGLFCAVAGLLFGHATLLDIAMSTVLLQVIFYSVAVGIFVWAAGTLFPPAAVWAVGVLIAWLPKQPGLTQVDAIIAPVALLTLAALCARLAIARRTGKVPLTADVFVHCAFALWFSMRPDVLPAWLVVTVVLHWRAWRRLVIPLALFLAIGTTWGVYRVRHHRDFTLTTTSAGAGLFCGLWEVPSRFRFALACSDEVYFAWVTAHSPYQPQSAAANSFVTREVVRFWLTYPGHFVAMVYHKMLQALDGDVWPGYPTNLQVFVFGAIQRYWIVMALVSLTALYIAIGYEPERTLTLAWPLLLNAPVFWVVFASLGRFYSGVGVALIAAAIPPLFERRFYISAAARPRLTIAVVVAAVACTLVAKPLDAWLLANDSFHYWTPFLDPKASSLSEFK